MSRISCAGTIAAVMAALMGCTTSATRLTPPQLDQRQALYRTCMDAQLEGAAFGSGMAVHEACVSWARKHTRATR